MRNVGRRRTPGLIWGVPWLSLAAALAGCAPRDRSAFLHTAIFPRIVLQKHPSLEGWRSGPGEPTMAA